MRALLLAALLLHACKEEPKPTTAPPPPAPIKLPAPLPKDPAKEFKELVNEVCKCKDTPCLSAFDKKYRAWLTGPTATSFEGHQYGPQRAPDADRMVECLLKILPPKDPEAQRIKACAPTHKVDGKEHAFEGAGIYSGHPKNMAQLKFNEVQKKPKKYIHNLQAFSDFYWIVCRYKGGHTTERPLPLGSLRCEMSDSRTNRAEISCRRTRSL